METLELSFHLLEILVALRSQHDPALFALPLIRRPGENEIACYLQLFLLVSFLSPFIFCNLTHNTLYVIQGLNGLHLEVKRVVVHSLVLFLALCTNGNIEGVVPVNGLPFRVIAAILPFQILLEIWFRSHLTLLDPLY